MPTSIYAPLVRYLQHQDTDQVFLTFAEIEALLNRALAKTARVNHGYWKDASYRHVADLERAGWEARLHVTADCVAFRRISTL